MRSKRIAPLVVGVVGIAVGWACLELRPEERWYYDEALVEEMAPDCLAAGHHVAVCGCILHDLTEDMRFPALELEMQQETHAYPGPENSALAQAHDRCLRTAEALGLIKQRTRSATARLSSSPATRSR